jgi:hypothetical protein
LGFAASLAPKAGLIEIPFQNYGFYRDSGAEKRIIFELCRSASGPVFLAVPVAFPWDPLSAAHLSSVLSAKCLPQVRQTVHTIRATSESKAAGAYRL